MSEQNGNGSSLKIVMYLVGVIVTLICFIAIPTMASNMINNDKDSRARDTTITSALNVHILQAQTNFNAYTMAQEKHNGEMKSIITGMAKDIQYIKNNGG